MKPALWVLHGKTTGIHATAFDIPTESGQIQVGRTIALLREARAVSAVGYALMQRLHHKRLVVAVRCIPYNRQRSMLLRLREALGLDVAVPTPQPLQELVV